MSGVSSAARPSRRLRWTVVGAGNAAKVHHLPVIPKIETIELVGLCDISLERAQPLGEQYGVPVYSDLASMLEKEKPDVLDVCVGEPWHYECAMQGVQSGVHVLVEKPITHSVSTARELVDAAEKAGIMLGVNYNYRYIPAFRILKEHIDGGKLGELAYIHADAASQCVHHALDLMQYWGGEIESVAAAFDNEDTVYKHKQGDWIYCPTRNETVTLRFRSGALGVITASAYVKPSENLVRVRCVGSKGHMTIEGLSTQDVIGRVVLSDGSIEVPGTEEERAEKFNFSFRLRLAAFAQAILDAAPPTPDGVDGLRVTQLEEAIVRAGREGRFVNLQEIV